MVHVIPLTVDPQLWTRLEDAKRRLDASHETAVETKNVGALQAASWDYIHALHAIQSTGTGVTPRERQVLALIASGKSSKEIAEELGIAFRTVACHRYHLQTKLKAHRTADLTRAALRMGLIQD